MSSADGIAQASHWDLPLDGFGAVPESRERFLRLHAAPTNAPANGSHGTVVVIHGGYWKNQYGLDDAYGNAGTASLAPFFVQRGFTAVELEYRRRDHEGGGWPGTNEDILVACRRLGELHAMACGTDRVAEVGPQCWEAIQALRPDRLILIGHSAGGCLALWASHALSSDPSSVSVAAVVAAAPVADLIRGHELRVSDEGDAVELYMKCKPDGELAITEYQKASPAAMLPLKVPTVVVYGEKDVDVPPELVRGYVERARETATEILWEVVIPDADHFDVVNASSSVWTSRILPTLAEVFGRIFGSEAAVSLTGNV